LDTAKIEQLTGLKGTFIEQENVFNVSLPRTDIKPVVAGTTVNTEMGLTAWVAFTKADGHAMVMGDIVLLEGEVSPVMSSALNNGLDQIMRTSGSFKDGVYKIVIGRKATMAGHEVGKEMGINTWAAFAGSDQNAVVDGDLAMLESELQAVLQALRRANINIVAIHNHISGETPRYMFLHYWGTGPTTDLAKGLRAALDTQS